MISAFAKHAQSLLLLLSLILSASAIPLAGDAGHPYNDDLSIASLHGIGPDNAVNLEFDRTYSLTDIEALAQQQSKKSSAVAATTTTTNQHATPVLGEDANAAILEHIKREALAVGYKLFRRVDFTCLNYMHQERDIGVRADFDFGNGHLTYTPLLNVDLITDETIDRVNGLFEAKVHHLWCEAFGHVICKYDLTATVLGRINYGNLEIMMDIFSGLQSDTRHPSVTESCVNLGHHVNQCPKNYWGQFTVSNCKVNSVTVR